MDNNDSDLVALWKNALTTEEEKVFVQNFQTFIKYNDSDFVIDLDLAYQWIGFTRKDHTKRLLEKHFIEDKDYIIQDRENVLLPPKEEQNIYDKKEEQRGGHNKEYIMMTPDTFKSMCLLAQTKQGDIVREYYIKMEKIMMNHMENKMAFTQKQLALKDQELAIKSQELANKDDELKKELDKHKHTKEAAGIIYIVANQKEVTRELYKVGHTMGLKPRLSSMNTAESDSAMVCLRKYKTTNRFLAEKFIHAYLTVNKFNHSKEFFSIELTHLTEIIKYFINTVDQLCNEDKDNRVAMKEHDTKLKIVSNNNFSREKFEEILKIVSNNNFSREKFEEILKIIEIGKLNIPIEEKTVINNNTTNIPIEDKSITNNTTNIPIEDKSITNNTTNIPITNNTTNNTNNNTTNNNTTNNNNTTKNTHINININITLTPEELMFFDIEQYTKFITDTLADEAEKFVITEDLRDAFSKWLTKNDIKPNENKYVLRTNDKDFVRSAKFKNEFVSAMEKILNRKQSRIAKVGKLRGFKHVAFKEAPVV
jgi:hypothetical protein